jgi:phage terminase small subunit
MPNINKIGRVVTGELTHKEKIFAYEYLCNGLKATQAYLTAYGCSYNSAKAESYRLLQSDRVKNFIKSKSDEIMKRYDFTLDTITQELAACGFSNATDVVGIDGDGNATYTDTRVLDEGTQRAIAEVSVIGGKVNVKMHDKIKALQYLAKIQGAEIEFNQIIIALDRMGFSIIRGGNGKLAFVEDGNSVLGIDETVAKMIQLQETAFIEQEPVQNIESNECEDSDFDEQESNDEEDSLYEDQMLPLFFPPSDKDEKQLAESESKFEQKLDGILRRNPYAT